MRRQIAATRAPCRSKSAVASARAASGEGRPAPEASCCGSAATASVSAVVVAAAAVPAVVAVLVTGLLHDTAVLVVVVVAANRAPDRRKLQLELDGAADERDRDRHTGR